MFTRKTPFVALRGVHLDLKGHPPTARRLLELLDVFKALRINAVLAEYNAMYPWSQKAFRRPGAYSPATIERFLDKAAGLGIEIIPKVQCLAHSEMVLRHARFRPLREVPDSPAQLCPRNPGSREIVHRLIADVLQTHRGRIRHFHLGGDEAGDLGSCPKCRAYAGRHGKAGLYLQHVTPLLERLTAEGLRAILWDDMMRAWPLSSLRALGRKADLMGWSYAPDPFGGGRRAGPLQRYLRAGVTVWGASAYKGADGPEADRPDLEARLANNLAWAKAARRLGLKGVVQTAWSRYSDLIVQCEGIEASMDSLALCSAVLWDGRLPKDPAGTGSRFLRRGKLKALAGGRSLEIIAVSENIAQWRQSAMKAFTNILRNHPFHGEPDRINPAATRRSRERLVHLVRSAERGLFVEWKRLHKGLGPEAALNSYVRNRLTPFKELCSRLGKGRSGG